MSRTFKSLLLVPAVTLGIYACSGDDDADESVTTPGWEDVQTDPIDMGTTDEALNALATALKSAPAVSPSQAQSLSAPPAGELPRSAIPTFTWRLGATAGSRLPMPHRFANADSAGDAFVPSCRPHACRVGARSPGRALHHLQRRFPEHDRARRLPHGELLRDVRVRAHCMPTCKRQRRCR